MLLLDFLEIHRQKVHIIHGRWQSDRVGGNPEGHGYGLVQWTPYTNYTNWVQGDPSEMDNNIARILYEVQNNIQWGYDAHGNPPPYNFKSFTESTESAYDLAIKFLRYYERPLEYDQPIRGIQATFWYEFLGGLPPVPPEPEETKKHKFNWPVFTRVIRARKRY